MGVRHKLAPPLAGAVLAAVLLVTLRGFTVDDALISARYAFHIATGHGPRFNVGGAMTDGVTPILWPWVLAPLASQGTLSALTVAKWLGALAWLAGAGALAHAVHRVGRSAVGLRHLALLVAFGCPAVGAWGASGMETGLAMGLATAAAACSATPRSRFVGSILAGITASLRPEMLVWALLMGAGQAWCARAKVSCQGSEPRGSGTTKLAAAHMAAALFPFLVTCGVRLIMFGTLAPLAVRAKPSDLLHGAVYAVASLLVTGPPVAVLAPLAWRRLAPWPRWILAAFAGHTLVVIAVGGDWMPLSRLFAPVLPSLALVFAHLASVSWKSSSAIRVALCTAGQAFVLWRVGADAARVGDDRRRLIAALAPHLQASDVVAALDVGWVGACFDGTVVDLAGVTDPSVASLSGGHTTKAIPPMLFAEKNVTKLVLMLPSGTTPDRAWLEGRFARGVESHVARLDWVTEHFVPDGEVRSTASLRYLLLTRRAEARSASGATVANRAVSPAIWGS